MTELPCSQQFIFSHTLVQVLLLEKHSWSFNSWNYLPLLPDYKPVNLYEETLAYTSVSLTEKLETENKTNKNNGK